MGFWDWLLGREPEPEPGPPPELATAPTEADIAARLALWPSPTQAAHALMNDALTAGGGDNVTVLVVDAG